MEAKSQAPIFTDFGPRLKLPNPEIFARVGIRIFLKRFYSFDEWI